MLFFLIDSVVNTLVSYFFLGRIFFLFFLNLTFFLVESMFSFFFLEFYFFLGRKSGFFLSFLKIFLLYIPISKLELQFKMLQYLAMHDHPFFFCFWLKYSCTVILYRINTMNLPYIYFSQGVYVLSTGWIFWHIASYFHSSQRKASVQPSAGEGKAKF